MKIYIVKENPGNFNLQVYDNPEAAEEHVDSNQRIFANKIFSWQAHYVQSRFIKPGKPLL